MKQEEAIIRLKHKGVGATANRILVLKKLEEEQRPMSLSSLEAAMPNMDKSSIFRVLTLFLEHDVVHAFEDGRGLLNYELCANDGACHHNDGHIHFYCETCHSHSVLTTSMYLNSLYPLASLPAPCLSLSKDNVRNVARREKDNEEMSLSTTA